MLDLVFQSILKFAIRTDGLRRSPTTNAKDARPIVTSAVHACMRAPALYSEAVMVRALWLLAGGTLLGGGCAANVADTGGADYGVVQQPEQRVTRACSTPQCELARQQYPTCLRQCTAELTRSPAPDAGEPLAVCEARCDGLPDPLCERGISSGGVCCAASCGNCGGLGCSQRPGGVDECCVRRVQGVGESCLHQAAPCVL